MVASCVIDMLGYELIASFYAFAAFSFLSHKAVVVNRWFISDLSGIILTMLGSYNIRGFGVVNGEFCGTDFA